jgi:hypothetical protein
MLILIILALTFAVYPPALPWVGGTIAVVYVGIFLIDAAHAQYLSWAAHREYERLARKKLADRP